MRKLEDPKRVEELTEAGYDGYVSDLLLSLGVLETFQDRGGGLARADRLEEIGLKFYRGAAAQLRMLHHAQRGELEPMRRYREEAETLAVQGGSTWQTEVFIALLLSKVYQSTGDVVGLKHTVEAIDRWAREPPSLRHAAEGVKAAYELERGNVHEATERYGRLLSDVREAWPVGWADVFSYYARALTLAGRADEAVALLIPVVDDPVRLSVVPTHDPHTEEMTRPLRAAAGAGASDVRPRLDPCLDAQERAEEALAIFMERTGAAAGSFYLASPGRDGVERVVGGVVLMHSFHEGPEDRTPTRSSRSRGDRRHRLQLPRRGRRGRGLRVQRWPSAFEPSGATT